MTVHPVLLAADITIWPLLFAVDIATWGALEWLGALASVATILAALCAFIWNTARWQSVTERFGVDLQELKNLFSQHSEENRECHTALANSIRDTSDTVRRNSEQTLLSLRNLEHGQEKLEDRLDRIEEHDSPRRK